MVMSCGFCGVRVMEARRVVGVEAAERGHEEFASLTDWNFR